MSSRFLLCLVGCLPLAASNLFASDPFVIKVVDAENGWPVPMVELRTTSNVGFVTDNAGIVAFDLPELMNQETWLHVDGDGYEVDKDGFGFRGIRIVPTRNQEVTIKVHRRFLAKRLGRLTGSGLFAESQQAGLHADWVDQGIVGCDSIRLATHNGRLHWVWGDTGVPHYPLGLFHALGATTALAPLKSFEPPLRLRFDYFLDASKRPRNTAEMAGAGPTWLDGLVSLPDADGKNHLVCYYAKIKKPMVVYQTGLCVWNQRSEVFDKYKELWNQAEENETAPAGPAGHATFWTDDQKSKWVLFGDPFPAMRCKPTISSWSSPEQWEQLEPPKKVNTVEGEAIVPHRGSIVWNKVVQKWICVFCEVGGNPSPLGEIWYTQSDSPLGPWHPAVKILSHHNYSFYNPRIATELTPDDAAFILFEGTYTKTFSNNPVATARYDYNQILYRLDLADVAKQMER